MSYLVHNNKVLRIEIQIDHERRSIHVFLNDEKVGLVAFNRYPSEHFSLTELEPIREDLDGYRCGEIDDAEMVCEEKSTVYYLEWLKIEEAHRNGGYGRLLVDTAMHLIREEAKDNLDDTFMYVSSCAFDIGNSTALDNESLDRFYAKSGFESLYDIQGGSTLMMIEDMNNIVIKNDISIVENVLMAETFARNAQKRARNQNRGETLSLAM